VERWQEWCTATAALLTGIYAAEEARLLLERRYLDGHPAVFPDVTADWERLRESAERLAGLSDALRPLMDGRQRETIDLVDLDLDEVRAAGRSRGSARASRLVDEARAATREIIGNHEGAAVIAERHVRSGG